jgi:serine/threonine protein phosphatase PrpC
VEQFFQEKSYFTGPAEYLIRLATTCDDNVKEIKSGIDVSASGATGVFILIYDDVVYSASIGDSRAIIGCESLLTDLPVPESGVCPEDIATL